MNSIVARILFVLVASLVISRHEIVRADDAPKSVIVAYYANKPDLVEKDGKRAGELLTQQGISSIAAGSAGMSINVPEHQAAEARRILADAIKKEKLRITLVPPSK